MISTLNGLITSKVRIQILMRLFLNPERKAYLRELANEFDVSPSQVKSELDNLSEVGLLQKIPEGRQVNYSADTNHSLFPELNSMVRKAMGMDRILDSIVKRLGNLEQAYVLDDYAEGKDTGLIDLVLVGDVDRICLEDLITKTEKYINRKIRVLIFPVDDTNGYELLKNRSKFLLWDKNKKS